MRRNRDPRYDHAGLEYVLRDEMPLGWRHPVTGRQSHRDDPALEALGIYVRRSRYIAGVPQQWLADSAGIPQSQLSRLERALAPSMDVERLAWIERALDGAFPLGYCPHGHVCEWRRYKPRPTAEEEWAAEVERQREISRRFSSISGGSLPDEGMTETAGDDEDGDMDLPLG